MTRHHHHRRRRVIIPIPPTTAATVVFPFNRLNYKFDTTSYNPIMTQGRASLEEISQFLAEIEEPYKKFIDEYGDPSKPPSCPIVCGMIFIMFIPPLFIIFMCVQICRQSGWASKHAEVTLEMKGLVQQKGSSFSSRGLNWVCPTHFPRWIELWTGAGAVNIVPNMMPNANMMGMNNGMNMMQPQQYGIQMQTIQQYPNYNTVPQQQYGMNSPDQYGGQTVIQIQSTPQQQPGYYGA